VGADGARDIGKLFDDAAYGVASTGRLPPPGGEDPAEAFDIRGAPPR